MKRDFHITILFVAIVAVFISCSKEPENTIVNLKTAITGEINTYATYKKFEQQAKDEGYRRIANLFEAAAEAEAIHAKNHNAVLKKLGEPEFKPDPVTSAVKSTVENLQAAVDGENYEYEEVYPGFIHTAQKEKCGDAVDSFTWANKAEENHEGWFFDAVEILKEKKNDQTVPRVWFVCVQCGGLFIEKFSKCKICGQGFYVPSVFETEP